MRVLCLDVESNGLYGEAFAVGAVVLDESGEILAKLRARCPIVGSVDPWVRDNLLPVLNGPAILLETVETPRQLRDTFWEWFVSHRVGQWADTLVVVDCGYPVETNFLTACIRDDRERREWASPYPVHEVATLLLAAGVDPDVDREVFGGPLPEQIFDWAGTGVAKHHPTCDAFLSARCALRALQMVGKVAAATGERR